MSEKLRKRLEKRGRVDDGVDNNVNTAYFNVTTDKMLVMNILMLRYPFRNLNIQLLMMTMCMILLKRM
jgi:hypothetical protein